MVERPRGASGRCRLVFDLSVRSGNVHRISRRLDSRVGIAAKPHAQAFEAYESRLKPMVTRMQATSRRIGGHFVPESKLGLRIQSWTLPLLLSRPFAGFLARRMSAEELELDVP